MWEVYKITGPSGVYVGKSNDAARRWKEHLHRAARGSPQHVHRAIAKHGPECFSIEIVAQARTENDVFCCERAIIQQERQHSTPLYNKTEGGEGPSGVVRSPETCAKISASMKGKARPQRRGEKRSAETCARISEALRARIARNPEKHRQITLKANQAARGKKQSPEACANKSKAAKARVERDRKDGKTIFGRPFRPIEQDFP